MGSWIIDGELKYNPDLEQLKRDQEENYGYGEYPFTVPEVKLYGYADEYSHAWVCNNYCDNVIVSRENKIKEFINKHYYKLNIDGVLYGCDDIPAETKYSGDDMVGIDEYEVKIYDLKTKKVKIYKMVEAEERDMDDWEIDRFVENKSVQEAEEEAVLDEIADDDLPF